MQRLDVSGAVRPIYGSLGVRRLIKHICAFGSTFCSNRLQTMEYGAETSSLSAQHNGNEEKERK